MPDPALSVGALFMTDYDDGTSAKTCKTALNRLVVTKIAIAGKRCVVLEKCLDIITEMRPFRMSRDLCLLPRRQLGISLAEQLVGTFLKFGDFIGKIDVAAMGKVLKLLDLAFKLADWLFKL